MKVYSSDPNMWSISGGVDEKTYRKWIWIFIVLISDMEGEIVSYFIIFMIIYIY